MANPEDVNKPISQEELRERGVPREIFESAYDAVPPWDVPFPQPAIVSQEEQGELSGSVLDLGCGTGENALFLASRGHEVWGVDVVEKAIQVAVHKATERKLAVRFLVDDVLELSHIQRQFDSVIDSGCFHTFSDVDRLRYKVALSRVLVPGGRFYLLCFSEEEVGDDGPRRLTRHEIEALFSDWVVERIEPTRFLSHRHADGARAYFARVKKPS